MSHPPSPYVPPSSEQSGQSEQPAQSAQSAAWASVPTTYAPSTNPAGRVSLTLGVILAVSGLATSAYAFLIPRIMEGSGYSYATATVPIEIASWVNAAIALGALVFGLVGLSRAGVPKGAAGAGTALGASALASMLITQAMRLLY